MEKIDTIIELVGGALDVDRLLARLADPEAGREGRPDVGTRRPPMHLQRCTAVGGRRRGDKAHHTVAPAGRH